MITTASRYNSVQEYYFSKKLREVASLNSQGHDIINLGIGSPDLPPPKQVIKILQSAAGIPQNHGYQSYKGIPVLRESFAQWYLKHYNVRLNPEEEILPLLGSKEGITYISNAFLNEGDQVLVPDPGYPAYAAAARIAGATVRNFDLKEENDWLPDLDSLSSQDLSKVKIMWINYPNMPTGAKASKEVFGSLIQFAENNNILLCHDNPYSFILNEMPASIFNEDELSENVLELNSLSKSHNMAGWRVGMVAGKKKHIDKLLVAKSNVDSGMFLPVQIAAAEALNQPIEWYKEINRIYEKRRKIVWEIMKSIKCTFNPDQSGLFIWGKIPDSENSEKLADELLYKAHVFITPGFIFGNNGKHHIRISLCTGEERLQEALSRIKNFKKI